MTSFPMTVSSTSSGLPQCRRPSTWIPQTTRCEFFPVTQGCQEWNGVVSSVQTTLPAMRLDRVQNCTLWERYELEARQMSERNEGQINEMYIFHGSKMTDPYEIARSECGIDFRCSTRDRNLLGSGAYFSKSASKSDGYAYLHRDGTKQMIIASVLTGIPYQCPSARTDLTRPPERVPGHLYDTVESYAFEAIVVYDLSKSCPAYIISYRNQLYPL